MASAAEFPSAKTGAANQREVLSPASHWIVVRNSRFLVSLVFAACVFFALLSVCFALISIACLLPLSGIDLHRAIRALSWACAAVCTVYACPCLWKAGRVRAFSEARLDGCGVDFQFGTAEQPQRCFVAWDRIVFVYELRLGHTTIFSIGENDGSQATFSSSNFFRPIRLARMIAAAAGRPIQRG